MKGLAGRCRSFAECTVHQLKETEKAVEGLQTILDRLEQRGIRLSSATYASLLRQCTLVKAMSQGKRLHAHLLKSGYGRDRFLSNLLIHMYGNCGSLGDARAVFNRIRQPNAFSGNIMIAAYIRNGHLEDARTVFDKMPQRDVVSWTAMVAAYAQNGHGKEALELFHRMDLERVKPNKITFICVLDACASLAAVVQGRGIHASIIATGIDTDLVIGNALVNMYGKCGCLHDARAVFDKMPQRNLVSWNAIIAAYAQNGRGKEALQLFEHMGVEGVKPDKVTFISIIDACTNLVALALGQEIHASIIDTGFETELVVGTALVNMYGKCGSLDDARSVFNKLTARDVVSWNTMIAAYAQNGHGKEALGFFRRMASEGVTPNKITFICVLDACATLAALAQGKGIHASIVDGGFESDVVVGTALINMYGKCGSLDDAINMFDKMPHRNVVSWNTMIAAYAQNGRLKDAWELFGQMNMEGMKPDKITFTSILSACRHAALLDEGCWFLVSMRTDYGIIPTVEHYGCMIDLMGWAGQLDEAHDLINNMPFQADAVAWMAFLGACRINGNVERGACAAQPVFKLDPKNPAPYILLSNIYAAAGRTNDVTKVRQAMEDMGVKVDRESQLY